VREQLPATISTELVLRLLASEGALPLTAELRYDAADPYAVEALFDTGAETPVRWVFARDLLAEGVSRAVGEGDVLVRPAVSSSGEAAVHLMLTSPDGRAALEASAVDVSGFLAETYRLVARGRESHHVDLDAALTALLDA
jgi:hypothetical protein